MPVVEQSVRLFDGIRPKGGNFKLSRDTLRGFEKLLWYRILRECAYVPTIYQSETYPSIDRIGFGRVIGDNPAEELATLNKNREAVWLSTQLTNLYKRVASANPDEEIYNILLSVLYYHQLETQGPA